jgi:hypothetical protein
MGDDTGADSICCNESLAPITFHWYRENPSDLGVVSRFKELLAIEGVPEADIDRFAGDFRARILRAQDGKLRPTDHVKGPMRLLKNIRLFEIRWYFEYGEDKAVAVRMYHAEPSLFGKKRVVALHMHMKVVDPSIDINDLQDIEIAVAAKKYWDGKHSNWGFTGPLAE